MLPISMGRLLALLGTSILAYTKLVVAHSPAFITAAKKVYRTGPMGLYHKTFEAVINSVL